MSFRLSIPDAARETGIPESTIRRWLSEERLLPKGRKPYKVDVDDLRFLRDTLALAPSLRRPAPVSDDAAMR